LLGALPEGAGLPPEVAALYARLQASEARHFELYLRLAQTHAEQAEAGDWRRRLVELATIEAELVTTPDPEFRFHSGLPA
jgi:tRNA-(ms[2]io[6]A)-hydroxylase